MAQPSNTQAPLAELGTVADINNPGPYNFSGLQYPLDVATSSYQGHYINFFINVNMASNFYQGGSLNFPNPYPSAGTPGSYGTAPTPASGEYGGNEIFNTARTLLYQRVTQAISLYIPDTMQTNQLIEWEDSSVQGMGEELLKGGAADGLYNAAKEKFKKKGMNTLKTVSKVISNAGKTVGFAVNPQLLVLFRGIQPRHFQYEFYFTPKNEQEASAVRDIIYSFRFHAHPDVNETFGAFFIAPSTFDIEFMFRGKRNRNVHQVKNCILRNYSIDYAPFGWSTYVDGMPVQTRLVLHFQETDIITRKNVSEGY